MRPVGLVVLTITLAFTAGPALGQGKKGKRPEFQVQGKTIAEWTKFVAGKELLPRIQAINALMQAGPQAKAAAPALIELFREEGNSFLHPLAVLTLSRMGEVAVATLAKALPDKTPAVRKNAALTLGLIGPPSRPAFPALTTMFKDDSADVRQAAALALGRIGSGARPSAAKLHDLLTDRDFSVRLEAALALWRTAADTRGIKVLAELVANSDDALALRATEALGEVGTSAARDAVSALRKALTHKQLPRRIAAAETLARCGSADAEAVETLLTDLTTKEIANRRLVVSALGTLAKNDKALTQLVRLLADPEPAIRREAASALCETDVNRKPAREALESSLTDLDPGVRWWSAVALTSSGEDIRKFESELLRIFQFTIHRVPEPPARGVLDVMGARRAVSALGEIIKVRKSPLAAVAAASLSSLALDVRPIAENLYSALNSDDRSLRERASAAVATMNVEALPRLVRLLGSSDAKSRSSAASALGLIGIPARGQLSTLTDMLKDSDPTVRSAAAMAIWRIEGNAELALPTLNLVYRDFDNTDRWAAIEAIATINAEARPPIRGLLDILVAAIQDRDVRVRLHAARGLWRRTKEAKVVIPLIQEIVNDRDLFVRLTAVETLGEMATESRALPLLTTALDDRSPLVRHAVVLGLSRSLPVKGLVEQLASKNAKLRLAAVWALGLQGAEAKTTLPDLTKIYLAADKPTRAAIAEAVIGFFPDRWTEARAYVAGLEKLEKADEESRPAILSQLEMARKKLIPGKS